MITPEGNSTVWGPFFWQHSTRLQTSSKPSLALVPGATAQSPELVVRGRQELAAVTAIGNTTVERNATIMMEYKAFISKRLLIRKGVFQK
jgi:hypothetical protein